VSTKKSSGITLARRNQGKEGKRHMKTENKKATIIVHLGDFDKIMSALIIGSGFLSMGIPVTMFLKRRRNY